MYLRILVLTVALATTGCTAAQMKAAAIRNNSHAAAEQMLACAGAVYNEPDLAPLRQHLPFNSAQPTLEQMTDTSFVSDQDKALLLVEHDKIALCRRNFLDQIGKETPTFVPLIAAGYSRDDDSLIALLQKKITWGDHAKQVRDITLQVQAQLTAAGQQIDATLNQENQFELAQRQNALNAMANYMQTQEIINNMNQPVTTNCTGFGNSVNCISH